MAKKISKILVTGGTGFIGSHLVDELVRMGVRVVVLARKDDPLENLTDVSSQIEVRRADLMKTKECEKAFEGIDFVYHLAGKVAGVRYNNEHQAEMFSSNVLMGLSVLEAARVNKIKKILLVSSACVYPQFCKIPTPESEGFVGDPEPTNFGYGWAKRVLEVAGRNYQMQYGLDVSIVRPYNCYGPRDHFNNPDAHVIPAIIKRVFDNEDPLVVWGNGRVTRSFLYVQDLARGMILAMEKGDVTPVNLGTDDEISIKNLVYLILKISGKNPRVVFDTSKPSGQPRRNCDTTLAKKNLRFEARIKLENGLKKTIEWYRKNL